MNAKPIIFQDAMVQALIGGRKTQTRRVVKPQPDWIENSGRWFWPVNDAITASREWWEYMDTLSYCPYGQPNETLLWVREAFIGGKGVGGYAPGVDPDINPDGPTIDVIYRADDGPNERSAGPWSPSIHMPRWASRLTLRLTDVRVERVRDISQEDAVAEGLMDGGCLNCGESSYPEPCGCADPSPDYADAFFWLWDQIYEEKGFGVVANPWVWVLEFEVINANVDKVIANPAANRSAT